MTFISIVRVYGDVPRNKSNQAFPDEWPYEIKEFSTRDEALTAYPGKPVLTSEQYEMLAKGLEIAQAHLAQPKAWWQFWK